MQLEMSVDDLIAYTEWQRARWLAWFRDHPDALNLSAGPNGDGRFSTVGDLVKHVFSAETRYVERLNGEPLTDFAAVPSADAGALFEVGEAGRRRLKHLLDTFAEEQWDVPREFKILSFLVLTTPRKIVVHTLIHEIRHWAQISTICRLNGLVGEFHDFLASPVWGGQFTQV